MKEVHEASATDGKDVVLKEHKQTSEQTVRKNRVNGVIAGSLVVITFIGLVVLLKRKKKNK
jgi:cobaltochelatase CobN